MRRAIGLSGVSAGLSRHLKRGLVEGGHDRAQVLHVEDRRHDLALAPVLLPCARREPLGHVAAMRTQRPEEARAKHEVVVAICLSLRLRVCRGAARTG